MLETLAEKVRVLIADDHPLMRRALRDLIEKESDLEVIAEAGDGEEAINLAAQLHPDVIIMDITMPGINGLEATREIKRDLPRVAILVLTVHSDTAHILALLEAGAAGYLVKSIFGSEVPQAIRSVVSGEAILSTSVLQQLLRHSMLMPSTALRSNTRDSLSAREIQILELAAAGMTNKEIASSLNLSTRTVKGHFVNLFCKLHVGSRTEAVLAALRAGVFSLDNLG